MAVLVEWDDLDPRLGYRSSHIWRSSQFDDCLSTAAMQLDRLRAGIEQVAAGASVSIALPTLPLFPAFRTPLGWGDPIVLALQEQVYGFARAVAGIPAVRVVNPLRLEQLSPLAQAWRPEESPSFWISLHTCSRRHAW